MSMIVRGGRPHVQRISATTTPTAFRIRAGGPLPTSSDGTELPRGFVDILFLQVRVLSGTARLYFEDPASGAEYVTITTSTPFEGPVNLGGAKEPLYLDTASGTAECEVIGYEKRG